MCHLGQLQAKAWKRKKAEGKKNFFSCQGAERARGVAAKSVTARLEGKSRETAPKGDSLAIFRSLIKSEGRKERRNGQKGLGE